MWFKRFKNYSKFLMVILVFAVIVATSCTKSPTNHVEDKTVVSENEFVVEESGDGSEVLSTSGYSATYDVINNILRISWNTTTSGKFNVYRKLTDNSYRLLTSTTSKSISVNNFYAKDFYQTQTIEIRLKTSSSSESKLMEINRSNIKQTFAAPKISSSVMYKLFIRSFYDSDGDSVGDFKGVQQKVDYLKDLGVDTVWFLPFNKAKSYHGYDVEDYYDAEPDYGTMKDLEEMIKSLNNNGINVVLDLVVNHTSDTHPYFLDAVERTTSSPYWNWYLMSLSEPANKNGWHYKINSKNQKVWYFGLFDSSMPDLNFDNPAVREEIKRIIDFWLTVGVNGFRLDAVKHYYGWSWDDGVQKSAEASREIANYILSKLPTAIIVGELFDGNPGTLSLFAPMPVFNFTFMFNVRGTPEGRDNLLRDSISWVNGANYKSSIYHFPFIDNHDLHRLVSVFVDETYKNNYNAAIKQYLLLNGLLLSMDGMPAIYYGNEIGLRGWKWNSDPWDIPVREPMQWYKSQVGSGQTSWTKNIYKAKNITLGNANNDGAIYDNPNDGVSVEEQLNGHSIYNFFRQFIKLRKSCPALSQGRVTIERDWKNLYVIKKTYGNQEALILINLDPTWKNNYTVPSGYRWVWYAFFNDNLFEFGSKNDSPLSQSVNWTVNPRQIYVFVK